MGPSPRRTAAALLALALSATGAAHAQAGASAPAAAPRHTEADVRFMQHMIHHHAQALEMTSLVATRTTTPAIRLLAERIDVSQQDEIGTMQRWLRARGAEVPAVGAAAHAGHGDGHAHAGPAAAAMPAMPGMLTAEEMARLAAASGPAFDRLFLESMIRHHEGALVMVAELLAHPGAAQESETYAFVSEVDADQRMEIDRMRRLLGAP